MSQKNKSNQASGKKSKSAFLVALAAVVAVVIAAGVVAAVTARSGQDEIKLPDYANSPTAPKDSAKAYRFALDNPEYLAAVPCYCGCGDMAAPHKSNLECYIKSRDGNKVEFDDHASY